MTQDKNRRVILTTRATGLPTPELFTIIEDSIPTIEDGQILLKNIYISADPGMKGWISKAKNYASVETGSTMSSFGVGVVIKSQNSNVNEGDYFVANTGWQDYSVITPDEPGTRKIDPSVGPLSAFLGVLGHSALTAYFGLLDIGQPSAGETVLVSTAAGSVGSAVGQIANIKGCRTIGITGGKEKSRLCTEEFGFDSAVDYKSTQDLEKELKDASPNGYDVYYDNVGGKTLDIVTGLMNQNGRIVICGTAATEEWLPPPTGMRLERQILISRLQIKGFILFDFRERYEDALSDIYQWFKNGKLNYKEDISDGLEKAPSALSGLYRGENTGRCLIRVNPDPTL